MVTRGHTWSHVVTRGHTWSHVVTVLRAPDVDVERVHPVAPLVLDVRTEPPRLRVHMLHEAQSVDPGGGRQISAIVRFGVRI